MNTNYANWVQQIIDSFYPENENPELRNILITHSCLVAEKAMSIAKKHPEMVLDFDFIQEAAMLHDIGIFLCDAPSIFCKGTEPYLRHGFLGAQILRKAGYPRHARVCERHTGAGLTRKDIMEQELPLPLQDYLPETLEEKLICYADKFFSKSHLTREKTFEQALNSMKRFGNDSADRLLQLHHLFE